MKIVASQVAMEATHSSYSYEHTQHYNLTMKSEEAAELSLSKDSSLIKQLSDIDKEKKSAEAEVSRKRESGGNIAGLINAMSVQKRCPERPYELQKDEKIKLLERILEILRRMNDGSKAKEAYSEIGYKKTQLSSLQKFYSGGFSLTSGPMGISYTNESSMRETASYSESESFSAAHVDRDIVDEKGASSANPSSLDNMTSVNIISNAPRTGTSTVLTRVTASESTWLEAEDTAFKATGSAYTSDGRKIDFGVEIGMSRKAAGITQELFGQQYRNIEIHTPLVDPLVINIDSQPATVSDQKFYFDIDADGIEDEISELNAGSGYLAYDKNGDGIINDGSELFGTKSGDGFKDLAAYDEDGNGWIDENDSIFDKLRVWTVGEDGKKTLLSLKQADVGAMYLGSASTEFRLKDDENNTNAVVRSTGVYLKESGGAGTMQHIDLAVG